MYTLTKRVLPQHTDYAGVMWHGAYVQWLEEARVEALQAAGLGYAAMTAMAVDMPVVSLHLDYRQPLRHGDQVCVESRCPGQQGVRWPQRNVGSTKKKQPLPISQNKKPMQQCSYSLSVKTET